MPVTSLPTLLLALLLAGPALWHAFVLQDLDIATALARYLLAVLVSAVMLGVLRRVTASYGTGEPSGADGGGAREAGSVSVSVDRVHAPRRRATDGPEPPSPAVQTGTSELPAAQPAALTAGDGR